MRKQPDISGLDMTQHELCRVSFDGTSIQSTTFGTIKSCTFDRARLDGCVIGYPIKCSFLHSKLRACVLGSRVSQNCFRGADLRRTYFLEASGLPRRLVVGNDFAQANLAHADLRGLVFRNNRFTGTRLEGCRLTRSRSTECNFDGADVRSANLRMSTFCGVNDHEVRRLARAQTAELMGAVRKRKRLLQALSRLGRRVDHSSIAMTWRYHHRLEHVVLSGKSLCRAVCILNGSGVCVRMLEADSMTDLVHMLAADFWGGTLRSVGVQRTSAMAEEAKSSQLAELLREVFVGLEEEWRRPA